MKLFSVIFSACLSLLVALPVCCCSLKADQTAGCCQKEQESGGSDYDPEICACSSHDAKDKPEALRLPDICVVDIIQPDSEPSLNPNLHGVPYLSANRPWIVDDPLGDVFARYSRWII